MKRKWRGEIFNLTEEVFWEGGKKFFLKTIVCLMMDTFIIHTFEIRIWNMSMQIKYKNS